MTYNNIEFPQVQTLAKTPRTGVYDGPTMALIHDGVNRHVIIKNIETAVTIPEPDLVAFEYAHVMGGDSNNIYILNPYQRQIKKLTIAGNSLNTTVINLNDFNRLKDISIVGTNTTRNNFIPQAGYVNNNLVIIGGEIENAFSLTIGGEAVVDGALCYMSSEDSGATFSGPWFPFVNGSNVALQGTVVAITDYLDNYYFEIVQDATASNFHLGVQVVEALGADLIGDYLTGHPVLLNTATDDFYQLPMIATDKKIYFTATDRNSYYVHDLETDVVSNPAITNITNIAVVSGDVYITSEDSCTPTVISPTSNAGENPLMNFYLMDSPYDLNVKSGKILVDDDQGVGPTYLMLGGPVQSDHFLQPTDIISVAP